MLSFRDFFESDVSAICSFPRTPEELFYMFPSAVWPLTVKQLIAAADSRLCPTVVLCDGRVAGYANFIACQPGQVCTVGNVIVDPQVRRQGVGTFLIRTMVHKAVLDYGAFRLGLRCFGANEAGLRFYDSLGFKKVGVLGRVGLDGCVAPTFQLELNLAKSGGGVERELSVCA